MKYTKCKTCKRLISSDMTSCIHCGSKISPKKTSNLLKMLIKKVTKIKNK